ncbi:hypothetical protein RJ641_009286, partial [Dillenia turbinata]
ANVFVNVVASVQYRAMADKAIDAFYKLSNTRTQGQPFLWYDPKKTERLGASVPKLNLDDVFKQKNDIAKAVEDELEKTLIVDIEPDEHMKRPMNEINAAKNSKSSSLCAEVEAEAKYLAGLGITHRSQAIVDCLHDSMLGIEVNVPGTTVKDVMDMVLITQYIDTMKEISALSKFSAVFIPRGPGAVRDVATQNS